MHSNYSVMLLANSKHFFKHFTLAEGYVCTATYSQGNLYQHGIYNSNRNRNVCNLPGHTLSIHLLHCALRMLCQLRIFRKYYPKCLSSVYIPFVTMHSTCGLFCIVLSRLVWFSSIYLLIMKNLAEVALLRLIGIYSSL